MRIAMFGVGPVGLSFGTVLAETGNDVCVFDRDASKIDGLKENKLPIFERGLAELIARNVKAERLRFSSDPGEAMQGSQLVFVAVGAPEDAQGDIDLQSVKAAAVDIARFAEGPLTVALRTTLPIGTTDELKRYFREACPQPVALAYNPSFAQDGRLVDDYMRPDRVLVGTRDEKAERVLADLYAPYLRTFNPLLFMDPVSAEVAKLTVNALLASRISFMNEVAGLCTAAGADISQVRRGVGADSRLGRQFLYAGIGYGGPRFPRDVRDLVRCGNENGMEMSLLQATDLVNQQQYHLLARQVQERYGDDLSGKTFAVWGLAFKAGTDDVRHAPSLTVVQDLLDAGARVQAFDPQSNETARQALTAADGNLVLADDMMAACQGAQALLVTVEWNAFRQPDFDQLKSLLIDPLIFDGRNLYDPKKMKALGFDCVGIGRKAIDN